MRRRTFLQRGAAGLVAARAAARGSVHAEPGTIDEQWMHGFGGDDPKATAQALKAAGFDVVVSGGEEVIEAVNAAGMRSWMMGGAFGLGKHKDDPSYKANDVYGRPQVWFGSGSPNHPELRKENLAQYERMAAQEGVEGILVDGCRFASPASGLDAFFTDFSEHSKKKAGALGFDFDRMHRDVKALYDDLAAWKESRDTRPVSWLRAPAGIVDTLAKRPGIFDWLRFRRVCATEHFRAVHKILKDAGRKMGVYIFTPSLSPLVGQSYEDLASFVDVFSPMIYRNYPKAPGPACLNWELTNIPEELGLKSTEAEEPAMQLVLSFCGLDGVVDKGRISTLQKALPPAAVGQQTKLARARLGEEKTLIPIIYIDDPDMAATCAAVKANGANGVNFFRFQANWNDHVGGSNQ